MPSARKHASNLLEEDTRPEGLGEHRTGQVPHTDNAGDEQYGRWSLEAGKAVGEFQSVHHGQQEVGYDKVEAQRAADGQSRFAIIRREDSVALISQRLRQDSAEHCVVLHEQDRLPTRLFEIHDIGSSGRNVATIGDNTHL
jgi:hypothetical protein